MKKDLLITRVILFSFVATAFPMAAILVYHFGMDRHAVANGLSVIYGFGLILAIFASLLPFKQNRDWSVFEKIQSLVLVYLGMSYITHLSWELGWLLFHNTIIAEPNTIFTYPWRAYIDGGDARYASAEHTLIVMEILSVCNGLVGAFAFGLYMTSQGKNKLAILMMSGTAVVHLYSASLYYLTEILFGLPNVGDDFIAKWIKFGLANSPWVICPWLTFWWAYQKLAKNKN